jgi:hypothetical protein
MACRSFKLRSNKESIASLRWMEKISSLDGIVVDGIELAPPKLMPGSRVHIARDKPKWRQLTAFPLRQE